MPLYVLEIEPARPFGPTKFAVIRSGSRAAAYDKARQMWYGIDGIFLRKLPRDFDVPADVIDQLVSEEVAQSIMNRACIAEDDGWMEIPIVPPETLH